MANTSISNLAAGAAVSATDLLPNVQTAGVGPVKTTAAQLKTFMSASPNLVTPALGTPTSGDFSSGTFTWPTFNQNTTGTAAGLSATLSIASGGTNATSFTTNYVTFFDGTKLTGSSNLYWDNSNKRLGIGTSSPACDFQISGSGGANYSQIVNTTGANFWECSNTGGNFYFAIDNSAGNFFGSGAYVRTIFSDGAYPIQIWTNGASRLTISSTGTLTAPAVYSTAVGATYTAAYVDNTGLIGYLSSVRASKMNISPIQDANWVSQLNTVNFNYRKKDESGAYTDQPDGPIQYGLIAEEVELVNADMCRYDENGNLISVSYEKLVIPLLKAYQQLKSDFDAYVAAHP